jgi:hypothetical protein
MNKTPLYCAGETYFLSHKHGMPARIFVEAVYKKYNSKEWMYCIRSEANNGVATYVSEPLLNSRISKHRSRVYQIPDIAERVDNGYRFCGNFDIDNATKRGEAFARNGSIKSVMLYPALNTEGEEISGMYGVWIKWDTVISDKFNVSGVIKIK